jgi:hypothetical protein
MKTTLEFTAEEQEELRMCLNGWRYHSVIWDLQQFLRSEMKHGDLSDIQYVSYEKIRTKLFELIETNQAQLE